MRRVVLLLMAVVLVIVVGIAGGTVWLLRQVPSSPVLLVQHADGNLAIVDAKGGQRALTDDADGVARAYDFPVPSPDGASVAYVRAVRDGPQVQSALIVHDLRGDPHTLFESTDVAPFYLYWSPDSRQLAFLGGSTNGMLLQNVNTRGEPTVEQVTPGAPSYFAWRPDSQQLLLHTSGAAPNGSLSLWSPGDDEPQLLQAAPAFFNAPAWLNDGKGSVVVLQDDDSVVLAKIDATGKVEQRLADGGTGMIFSVSPDGTSVAFTPIEGANIGPLYLVGMDGTDARPLTSVRAYAFVWSPDGSKIAYLTIPTEAETRPAALRQQTDLQLTWNIAEVATGKTRELHTFTPTTTFVNLLPYFDQYAQSMRLWDERGERLVFADTEGVWTLDVATGATTRIDDGVLGMWIKR